jgi:hypothetical protein
VALLGDAAMIVHQARGDWPCKTERFKAYHAQFTALARVLIASGCAISSARKIWRELRWNAITAGYRFIRCPA